jgi:hypothetical protein
MNQTRNDYRSYVLRMWHVKGEQDDLWRCSLEDIKTGEQRGFACLEELMAFLTGKTATSKPAETSGEK